MNGTNLETIGAFPVLAPIGADAAPNCEKGIPFGNSCISAHKVGWFVIGARRPLGLA
jgi:hypothetical protein